MSRHRNPGRRRAPGAVRRLPDGFTRLGATWATKSIAAIGVLGGAAVALALPVDASPAALTLATPAATSSVARTDGLAASRGSVRSAAPALAIPAVSAPEGAAPIAPEQVGVAGVKAVAKPKPKPKPKPVAKATSSGSDSSGSSDSVEAPSSSYSTSISGQCGSIGLNNDAARLCSAVDSIFHLGSIGGYRANAGEHSTGQAVDFMISSRSQGDSDRRVGAVPRRRVQRAVRHLAAALLGARQLVGPHGGPRFTHGEPLWTTCT